MEMMKHTKDFVSDHSGNPDSDLTVIVVISVGGENGFEVLKESTYRYGSWERKPLVFAEQSREFLLMIHLSSLFFCCPNFLSPNVHWEMLHLDF